MKRLIFTALLIGSLTLSGCGGKKEDKPTSIDTGNTGITDITGEKNNGVEQVDNTAYDDVFEYFPMQANCLYEYANEDTLNDEDSVNVQSNYLMYDEVVNGIRRIQRRNLSYETLGIEMFEYRHGAIYALYGSASDFYPENMIKVFPDDAQVYMTILKEPVAVGEQWQVNPQTLCEITGTDLTVEVPCGTYDNVIELTWTQSSGFKSKYYFAKGIGLIKVSHINSPEQITTFVLTALTENSGFEISYKLYLGDDDSGELVAFDNKFVFYTNIDLSGEFTDIFKQEYSGYDILMTKDASILSINVDRENDLVTIDLNEAFKKGLTETSGASREGMVLNCITRTIGRFYNVSKVRITVKGENYSSGHYEFNDNDYFDITEDEGEV